MALSQGDPGGGAGAAGALLLVLPEAPPGPECDAAFERMGLRRIGFLPPAGFLARVESAGRARAALPESGARLAPLRAEWKTAGPLRALLDQPPSALPAEVGFVVFSTRADAALEKALRGAGASITGKSPSRLGYLTGVRAPFGALRMCLEVAASRPDVFTIAPGAGARLLNDNASAILQSGAAAGGRPLWARGLRGEGQVIAICDTGLDYDSCFFRDADNSPPPLAFGFEAGQPDFRRRKVLLYNFLWPADAGAGADRFDNQGHGTLVAGNAAGARIDLPVAENVLNGVAPAAWLIVQDAGFASGDDCADLPALGCPVVNFEAALEQAAAQGAHFHNNSWGDRENYRPQNTYTAPTAGADAVAWEYKDFLILCAAGNAGAEGLNSVGSPGVAKNVICVGATESPTVSGNPERRASFSGQGWASDGRVKPDLMSPGQTRSARSDLSVLTSNCATALAQGTSMATPTAAGAAAIARQYFTEGWYPAGRRVADHATTPSAALLKAVLIQGAVDMLEVPGFPPNAQEGWGRIHLENSLYFEGAPRRLLVYDFRAGLISADGARWIARLETRGRAEAGPLKIVLVWTDPPALPMAATALVNDLNLQVRSLTDGRTWKGNVFDPATGLSMTGGEADALNNVEVVILPAGEKGIWEVSVSPARIVEGPQPFALAVGGDARPLPSQSVNHWVVE